MSVPCPSDDSVFASSFLAWICFEDDGSIRNLKQGGADWSSADGENRGQLDKVVCWLWHAWVVVATTIDPEEACIRSSDDVRHAHAQEMPPNWSIGYGGLNLVKMNARSSKTELTASKAIGLTVEPCLRSHVNDVQSVVGQFSSLEHLVLVSGIRSVDIVVQRRGTSDNSESCSANAGENNSR